MDLRETSSDRAFREEARSFIAKSLPKDLKDKSDAGQRLTVEDGQRWHKILAAHGWGAPGWPKEHGGCAWDHSRQYIWEEEMAMAGCPPLSPFAVKMVGPVIMAFGTPDDVYREVRERIDVFNDGGGFVFNAIHNVQGNVPIENVLAMFRAVRDSGS